jgi:enoyl-CoA hydratase
MSYETILYEKEAGFCLITLNRPKSLNALNIKMWAELENAVDEVDKDPEIKAFIFTGAPRPDGRPCFCAGLDLKEAAGYTVEGQIPTTPSTASSPSLVTTLWAERQPKLGMIRAFEKLAWSPKISIAAIDGVCTAGGIELALSCDIILVSETAQISDMHVKNLGWIGGAAATPNMAWRVGVAKAIELCCTGDVIDGKEAHRIGFANQVFPPHKLLDGAKEMGRKLGGMRLAALTMTKATCRAVQDMDYRSSWYYTDAAFKALQVEADTAEWGPGRWVEKR